MKAYGVERALDREFPDKADIQYYAMKTSVGRVEGDVRASFKSDKKRKMRRYWKRRARRDAKNEVNNTE